jgi:soluble lytic murein transglycosylase-like protein
MSQLIKKYGGSEAKGLAAYNAGSGSVDNALAQSRSTGKPWYLFLPTETQNYIKNIDPGMN